MDAAIIDQMRTEEATLARKLKAVRDLLAAYDVKPSNDLAAPKPQRADTPARGKVGIEGYSSYGRLIVAESMRAMSVNPKPVKTRDLVGFIEAMGVSITGENKVNAVGALLYRSADIESHGKAGWSLRDRESAQQIIMEYGIKNANENGAAEAAPEAEEVGASSSNSQSSMKELLS